MPFTTPTTYKKVLPPTPSTNMIPKDTEIFTSATPATYKLSDNINADDHHDKDKRNCRVDTTQALTITLKTHHKRTNVTSKESTPHPTLLMT